jgi:hypothetical protein
MLINNQYSFSRAISHQGIAFTFFLSDTGKTNPVNGDQHLFDIKYLIQELHPDQPDDNKSWTLPQSLLFPKELRAAGMNLLTVAVPGQDENDTPNSSSIFTEKMAFHVVSDNDYLYLFRLCNNGTGYRICVDRFIYDQVTGQLNNAWEVRYRRSRNKDLPLSNRDSFGFVDMDGEHFVEPTLELTPIQEEESINGFAVVIVPTELKNETRWQFFTAFDKDGKHFVKSYSLPRKADGLFDFTDLTVDKGEMPASDQFNLQVTLADNTAPSQGGIISPMMASLYYRQERVKDSYGRIQFVKRDARVALAFTVTVPDTPNNNARPAVIDFGVGRDGTLAKMREGIQTQASGVGDNNLSKLILTYPPSLGAGLNFTGQNYACQIGGSGMVKGRTSFSFEAWVYLHEVGDRQGIFGCYGDGDSGNSDDSDDYVELVVDLKGGLEAAIKTNGVGVAVTTAQKLQAKVWYHVAFVLGDGKIQAFLNGEPTVTETTLPLSNQLSGDFHLGTYNPSVTHLRGILCEIRLWQMVRSVVEIKENMTRQVKEWESMLAYWPTNSSQENRPDIIDNSANDNNLSLNGTQWCAANAPLSGVQSSEPLPTMSMPIVSMDDQELTICANVLSYDDLYSPDEKTYYMPDILNGGDGILRIYFTGQVFSKNTARAIPLNTLAARTVFEVSTSTPETSLFFVARQLGSQMVNAKIFFSQQSDGRFTLTLKSWIAQNNQPIVQETWTQLPDDVNALMQILNGQAAQRDSDSGPEPSSTDPATTDASIVEYDYGQNVVVTGTEIKPAAGVGSRLFTIVVKGMPEDTSEKIALAAAPTITLNRCGIDPYWIANAQGACLNLEGTNNSVITIPVTNAPQLDLRGDLTLEAWVKKTESGTELNTGGRQIISYNHKNADGQSTSDLQYGLYLDGGKVSAFSKSVGVSSNKVDFNSGWNHLAAAYEADYAVDLDGTASINFGNNDSFTTPDAMTFTTWVRPNFDDEMVCIASKWDKDDNSGWSIQANKEALTFTVALDSEEQDSVCVTLNHAMLPQTWYQLVAIFDVRSERVTGIEFDGYADLHIKSGVDLQPDDFDGFTFEACLLARKRSDVTAKNYPYYELLLGKSGVDPSKYKSDMPPLFYLEYSDSSDPQTAKLGIMFNDTGIDKPVSLSASFHAIDQWNHVCVSYDAKAQELVLYANGNVIDSLSHNMTGKLAQGKKIDRIAGTGSKTQYNGFMRAVRIWDRGLATDEVRQAMNGNIAMDGPDLLADWPMRERYGDTVRDSTGVYNTEFYTDGGDITWATRSKGQFICKLLLQEGLQKGAEEDFLVTEVAVRKSMKTNNASLYIGSLGGDEQLATMAMDESSFWNVGLRKWQVPQLTANSEKTTPNNLIELGLVSYWPVNEAQGRELYDKKSDNAGVVEGGSYIESAAEINGLWIASEVFSGWSLYLNGEPLQSEFVDVVDTFTSPVSQTLLALGARPVENDQYDYQLNAALADVRIWDSVRTEEQIRDGRFAVPDDSDDQLVGYWPCRSGSGQAIEDSSRFANSGKLLGSDTNPAGGLDFSWVWPELSNVNSSTPAPVGDEAPYISNAGKPPSQPLPSGFTLDDQPAVVEYGDAQFDEDNIVIGALKRCYALAGKTKTLINSGFVVGELEPVYLGQVQTEPTVTGVIEGAPPVPSENLTIDQGSNPDKYLGTSDVTLTAAENTEQVFSADRNTGFDTSLSTVFGPHFRTKLSVIAGFGMAVENESLVVDNKAGMAANFEHSLSDIAGAQLDYDTNVVTKSSLVVDGAWEFNQYSLDNGYGRLYWPNNMGAAFVKSKTADFYSFRLKRTGAQVFTQTIPNPDIPEDNNVIMFKVDSTKIKNGCLDGYTGFDKNSDYASLTTGEKGSYFKPLEAYALKTQIEREQEERSSYYEQFDASGIGKRTEDLHFSAEDAGNASSDLAGVISSSDSDEIQNYQQWKREIAQTNLVNSYVWTADGGLYAEEEQLAATRRESFGGSYHFVGKTGFHGDFDFVISNVGFFSQLDAMVGGHIDVTVSKQKSEGASFGLVSDVAGEGFLNARSDTPWQTTKEVSTEVAQEWVMDMNEDHVVPAALEGVFKNYGLIISQLAVESKPSTNSSTWFCVDGFDTKVCKITQNVLSVASSGTPSGAPVGTSPGSEFTLQMKPPLGGYPIDYDSNACPGKVRGYRFMSYYLEPRKKNFTEFSQVIDHEWLHNANDPDALALRQALTRNNEIWRVMHRVTYVSRVPQTQNGDIDEGESLAPDVIKPDSSSEIGNTVILQQVLASNDYAEKQTAVNTLVTTFTTNHSSWLMSADESILEKKILKFVMDAYTVD